LITKFCWRESKIKVSLIFNFFNLFCRERGWNHALILKK
jgi:hypothetical protein